MKNRRRGKDLKLRKQIVITKKELELWLKEKSDKAYDAWAGCARIAMAINNKPLSPKMAKECNLELFYYAALKQMTREHMAKRFIFPW